MGNRGDLKWAQKNFWGTKANGIWAKAEWVCSALTSVSIIINPGLKEDYNDLGNLTMLY